MATKILLGITLCVLVGMLCASCFVLGYQRGLETARKIIDEVLQKREEE